MAWCLHCATNCQTHHDIQTGAICCVECGKVVSQDVYTDDVGFVKDAGGRARMESNNVKMGSESSDSHRRTLEKGNVIIYELINKYGIDNVDHATKFYQIAVERGFTRGRRTNQVAAACLYVACREKEKPFLLIEFSSEIGVSVYELGTVYLLLCKLLSLQNHDFVQMPVDPSLFMHRYTHALIKGRGEKTVLNTALQLAVSMKSDWMQTGRKPSGICAAAIYVSSVLHGYNFSKTDVVRAVHICEATLTKRLIEFENTKAGSLTIEEFTEHAMEFYKESQLKMPGSRQVVCEHKNTEVQTGFGLCKNCYLEFCGGLDGSNPPAFQRLVNESTSPVDFDHNENGTKENETSGVHCATPIPKTPGKLDNIEEDTCESQKDTSAPATAASVDETDTLSEIDDSEVSCYLNNEEESRFKKIIWEKMNKEYMQEQAAKEAARKLYTGTSQEDAAIKREKDKNRRALEVENVKPPQTAPEAVSQLFKKKGLRKINEKNLDTLFHEPPILQKKRVDDDVDVDGGDDDGDNERNDGEGEEDNNDEWNYEEEMDGGYEYDDDDGNGYDDMEY